MLCAGIALLVGGLLVVTAIFRPDGRPPDPEPIPPSHSISREEYIRQQLAEHDAQQPPKAQRTVDPSCVTYSLAARKMVEAKLAGRTLAQTIRYLNRSAPPAVAELLIQDAKDIYQDPGVRQLSPEGAQGMYYIFCVGQREKHAGGRKWYSDSAEIAKQLSSFRTYNGKPLVDLLSSYGIKIKTLEVLPAAALPHSDLRPGDAIYSIEWGRGPSRNMPCRLRQWFSPNPSPPGPAEALRRDGRFPHIEPDTTDPVIYWAATGACSTAYSF